MKYNKKLFTIMMAFALLVTSCNDSFLDEDPYSEYGTGNTDLPTIEAQVIGLHRTFAELWGWSGQQGFLSIWQLGTDVATPGATQGVENPFYQYDDLNPENEGVRIVWLRCYEFINNANRIISLAGEEHVVAVAEAKFFRAYAYNLLVTLWGDVPLLTESITVPQFNYTRHPVAEVDNLIEEDLIYAIANLPGVGEEAIEGRINKDIARQLAAEAYLRMGMRDNSYFEKAEQAATDIIEGGNYELIDERYGEYLGEGGDFYRDMFRQGNMRRSDGNTEAIWTFQVEFNRDIPGGTVDNPQHRRVWFPAYHKIDGMVLADSLGGRGIARLLISNFMKYTVWDGLEGDIRNSNYNIRRDTYYNRPDFSTEIGLDADGYRVNVDDENAVTTVTIETGDELILRETDTLEVWYAHPTKWGGFDPQDEFGYALVKDWPVMRLGETYLLRAEARFRRGNDPGAAADINKLRDRAFKEARVEQGDPSLGEVTAADIDIDFILDERARELISEENRRYTLVRTGMLGERIPLNGDDAPSNRVITGFDEYNSLLPIPLSEVQLNNKEGDPLKQNPGYN